jgi:hypothetical protein
MKPGLSACFLHKSEIGGTGLWLSRVGSSMRRGGAMELEYLDSASLTFLGALGGFFLIVILAVVLWLLLTRHHQTPEV